MRRGALALLVLLPLLATGPAHAQPAAPALVVVGVAGLSWDDVDAERTPVLARLSARAAVGLLSVKAAGAVTCPADGWLTLGAGINTFANLRLENSNGREVLDRDLEDAVVLRSGLKWKF